MEQSKKSTIIATLEEVGTDSVWIAKVSIFVITVYLFLFGIVICPLNVHAILNIVTMLLVTEICAVALAWYAAGYIPSLEVRNSLTVYEDYVVVGNRKEPELHTFRKNRKKDRLNVVEVRLFLQVADNSGQ